MKLTTDNNANVKMIGGVLGLLITLAIGILVAYNIVATIDANTMDRDFGSHSWTSGVHTNTSYNVTPTQNATNATLNQMSTFFTIAPIIGIVIVAVVILGYVSRIGGG